MPLCNILEREYQIIARRGVETLDSTTAGLRESQLLESRKGFPLLLLTYTMFSQEEIPFEYSEVIFRGDRIKLKFEFHQ